MAFLKFSLLFSFILHVSAGNIFCIDFSPQAPWYEGCYRHKNYFAGGTYKLPTDEISKAIESVQREGYLEIEKKYQFDVTLVSFIIFKMRQKVTNCYGTFQEDQIGHAIRECIIENYRIAQSCYGRRLRPDLKKLFELAGAINYMAYPLLSTNFCHHAITFVGMANHIFNYVVHAQSCDFFRKVKPILFEEALELQKTHITAVHRVEVEENLIEAIFHLTVDVLSILGVPKEMSTQVPLETINTIKEAKKYFTEAKGNIMAIELRVEMSKINHEKNKDKPFNIELVEWVESICTEMNSQLDFLMKQLDSRDKC